MNIAPANVTALLEGRTYINIHTASVPGGEIRGNLIMVPEPTTGRLAALPLLVAGLGRRR